MENKEVGSVFRYCISNRVSLLTFGKKYEIIREIKSRNCVLVKRDDGSIDRVSSEYFGSKYKLEEIKQAHYLFAESLKNINCDEDE